MSASISNIGSRQRRREPVRILGPTSGATHTSQASAQRYVDLGRAEWIGDALRFVATDRHHQDVLRTAAQYDRIGRMMTRKELKALPMTGDPTRLLTKRSHA